MHQLITAIPLHRTQCWKMHFVYNHSFFGAAFKDDECLYEGSTHYPFQPAATDTKHEHPSSAVGSAA